MNQLVFYEGKNMNLYGKKAEQKGYYYPSIGINLFADKPVKIPENAEKKRRPSLKWIRRFMYDPNKTHALKLPPNHENADIYQMHDNGGVPFIVYVGNNLVSAYRIPKNTFVWEKNWSQNFKDNIPYYSELVVQYKNPVNVFIGDNNGIDDGNSILVQVSPRKYVYIGDSIYSFVTADKIDNYSSETCCSDMPYPVAVNA